ncbi:WYL domain-containing protein [Microbacterium sufflavum]|uniref:WYL domain-containing protein n=1 Tax=Microbacterium sufflavum TaxID=2851649 RepID=UPI0035566B67
MALQGASASGVDVTEAAEHALATASRGGCRDHLAARAKGSTTEDRWPRIGEVVIALPAREVVPWVGDGEVEERPDGRCRVTVGSWSWVGVLAAVARFDAPFTVVGPEPLREAAETLAARFATAADPPS